MSPLRAGRSRLVTLLLGMGLIGPLPVLGDEPTPDPLSPQTIAEMTRLQAAALDSDYAYRQVAHLCDNIGPRMSGSPQFTKAAEYVAGQLRAEGLEVRLEKVMVPHWVRGIETAGLVEFPGMAEGTTQRLAVTALGGSAPTPDEGITAEVVVAHDFDELDALGREGVSGKIVVFVEKFDKRQAAMGFGLEAYGRAGAYRRSGASAAARLGAVASLVRSAGGAEYRLPHTGAMRYDDDVPRIPAGALAAEDADLVERLAGQGTLRMHLVMTPRELPDVEAANVVADLRGSEHPEQVVVVSGHLDSWDLGTGAIDDAAGVGAAMAVAHLVRQLGLEPRRTIRVVAWANEELGLRGGLTYARDHRAEAADHVGAIEIDLGAGHPVGIFYDAAPETEMLLEPVSKVLSRQGAGLLRAAEETGADLIPLGVLGVPTFAPIQDERTYFDYHHTAADTLDKVGPDELRENAAVAAVLAWALANADVVPPHSPKPIPEWLRMRIEGTR